MYRRAVSPLHAARAAAGAAFCLALVSVTVVLEHPLVLAALLAAVLGAGAAAGVGRHVGRAVALLGVPFAVAIALLNVLASHQGATILVRGWTVPVLGRLDVTLEALGYGVILGLRAMIAIGCGALFSAAVDPDELLRGFRRLGLRSALTAALATRLVPVLMRDARRLRDAQRCRPGAAAPARVLVRAVTAGALDRAVDVAATLEVRGYGGAGARPARRARPWSRHDLAFAAAAAGVVALAIAALAGDWEGFDPYPRFAVPLGGPVWLLAGGLALCALLPFADRRGTR
ncbi:MAG TPA: energy-coupling factor transporter transmembrane component T [Solirubrobacteraceae bacterium]|jgi:energy-coupling factor transport system permease protein